MFAMAMALLVPPAAGSGSMRTEVATEDFNRADGSMGSNWAHLYPGWADADIVSNTIHAADATNEQSSRWVGAGSFTDDQYAKVFLATGSRGWDTDSYRIGVMVRASGDTDGNRDFYAAYMCNDADVGNACTTRLVKMSNGTETTLASTSIAWANGDSISLEVRTVGGNAELKAFRNDAQIGALAHTDSSSPFTTGLPGLYLQGSSSRPIGDDWSAGNVS